MRVPLQTALAKKIRSDAARAAGISADRVIPRLSAENLARLPETVVRPGFAPESTGILHLGCGAFHRAHQALLTQHAMTAANDPRWGIAAVAMSRPTVVDALRAQDNLYTTLLHDDDDAQVEVVGSITETVHAPTDRIGVPARMADPRIKIVTLTVTATGYCLSPVTGRLDIACEAVHHDIRCPATPITPVGMLVRGFELIRARGGTPPVVISCDNLCENGRKLRAAVVELAGLRDEALAGWIARNVQFPNSVVDRIVQPSTPADLAVARNWLGGIEDLAPVSAEPFMTWTIENFDGERPLWEAAGAHFVDDVTDYELAKLRLLNASHMLLAYVGGLAGYRTIAEASNDDTLAALARQFMLREQGPTLALAPAELDRTVDGLIRRFRNPAICHDMTRVGRNGSDKMVPRVVSAMCENIAAGRPTPAATLLIAAWIQSFADRPGAVLEVIDQHAESLKAAAAEPDPQRRAGKFLRRTDIFGTWPDPDRVRREVGAALAEFGRDGVDATVRRRLTTEFERSVA
ncbi:mannitol dehydrogenase family protein [Nocardia arthritidis]|uniref:Mannitol dehydrogenase family protein n=1 Tax=Nocardia arthritidis TaxID=228602 RepID=A0A6G9YFF5_9NOCA|nr:mannitol dehydrogenase family protein [Nocardia arthritidis]QIS11807.1 mannitol dehydrogenase family protein [Nocardia arthritidis]